MPKGEHEDSAATSDQELVAAVLGGDMDAFATLYRSHVGAVARAVRDNVHDNESVADVIQDVFFRALQRLPSLRHHEAFRPWLLAIARNAAIDHRRSGATPSATLDHIPEVASDGPGPDDLAELRELTELVRGCVAGLSHRDATALTLATQFGLSPSEVAICLGVSANAAKVILHRARRRLRNAVALELLVRRRAPGCEHFLVLLETDDVVAAGRHVRGCPLCAALVESEIDVYGQVGQVPTHYDTAPRADRGADPVRPSPSLPV